MAQEKFSDAELELIIHDAPELIMGKWAPGKKGNLNISVTSVSTLFNAYSQLGDFQQAKQTLTSDSQMMQELAAVRDFMLQVGKPETVAKLNIANNIRENNQGVTDGEIRKAFTAYDQVMGAAMKR